MADIEQRARFEAWWGTQQGRCGFVQNEGRYVNPVTHTAWQAWHAALASQAQVDDEVRRDAERFRWLCSFAINHEEVGRGTPYIVYGIGMGDTNPALPSEIRGMVDHSMARDTNWLSAATKLEA